MTTRCLICGAEASEVDRGYHPACARKLFGRPEAPRFDYTTEELNAMAERIIRNRMSVPGVQAKLSVHLERKGTGTPDRLTLVGLEGNYILKLPTERFPELPESEHACMSLARVAGIATADFGLVRLQSGALAYLSRRMDRPDGGVLHMEDFCQLSDRITTEKYRASMESVGKSPPRILLGSGSGCYPALRAGPLLLPHGQLRHAPQELFLSCGIPMEHGIWRPPTISFRPASTCLMKRRSSRSLSTARRATFPIGISNVSPPTSG
jgi:hypothetical protein